MRRDFRLYLTRTYPGRETTGFPALTRINMRRETTGFPALSLRIYLEGKPLGFRLYLTHIDMRRGTTGFPVLSYTFLPGKGNHWVSGFISLVFTGKGNHLVSGLTVSSNTCI